jgi:dihydropteroate synthase
MATTPAAPARGTALGLTHTVVMGVLNVTADSFSDGGRYLDPESAISRGRQLAAAGADVIDIGGESTRPGAHRVPAATEAERVLPVITELSRDGLVCSVDTTRASVAAAAVAAGARIVNDVSGGLADPEMAAAVADAGVPWILMHWRGHSADMDALARYDDVVADVRAELFDRVAAAVAAGVAESRLVLDPGLGFAKTAEHNWALLRALPRMTGRELTGGEPTGRDPADGTGDGGAASSGWGFPILIGASRKRFLGSLLADADGPRPPGGREDATTAISALVAAAGGWGVRVHEPSASLDAVRVVAATTGRAPVRHLDLPGVAAVPHG